MRRDVAAEEINAAGVDGSISRAPGPKRSVSVVIPVHNGEAFLERTVLSAAAQTYPISRIIVVNDGSTDGTAAVLDKLAARIANLQRIDTAHRGVAHARNTGTAAAETYYVAYLDADDLWHPTKLEKQVRALERHAGDPDWVACYTYFRRIDQDDRILGDGSQHETRGSFFASHLIVNPVGNGSSLLVRRSIALAVGGFDPSFAARGSGGCEDTDFQFRLLSTYKIELVPEYLTGYRRHQAAMSMNALAMARGYLEVIRKYSADSRVKPKLRHAALAAAYRYSFNQQLSVRDISSRLRTLLAFFLISPMDACNRVALFASNKSKAALAKWRRRARTTHRVRDAVNEKPFFGELEPTFGLGKSLSREEVLRRRKLRAFDREFLQ